MGEASFLMTFPDRRPPHHRPPQHWVIGDVHGCADALQRLLVQLPAGDRLVFCGDVINRGSRIEESMELVWDLVRRQRAVWLKGNHERDLVRQLDTGLAPGRPDLNGNDTYRQLGAARCRLWRDRLDQLPLAYWGQGWVATHAGFDPRTWQPDLNVRLAFWQAYDNRFGEVIVGHTPGPACGESARSSCSTPVPVTAATSPPTAPKRERHVRSATWQRRATRWPPRPPARR